MTVKLMNLPYESNALEPVMSKETVELHHGKHHNTYVVNLNKLTLNTPYENNTAMEIAIATQGKAEYAGAYNNAGQILNHNIFWHCMSPANTALSAELEDAINSSFGSLDAMKEEFIAKGLKQFGSGWVWLYVNKNNKLEITTTSNADSPITLGLDNKVLLGCDIWEHSYYVDYRNDRASYLTAWINKLVNWEYANNSFKNA